MVGFIVSPAAQSFTQTSPQALSRAESNAVRLFLSGDVMLGRGIDQVLPHSVDPTLKEPSVRDARRYVELARRAGARIPDEVGLDYVWGDALAELDVLAPRFRIINLETSITSGGRFWPGKRVHYRMHPKNVGAVTAAGVDICILANNHVLDFGRAGLESTLDALEGSEIGTVGAGRTESAAGEPAVLPISGRNGSERRLLVFGYASPTSGVPPRWAAERKRAGVNFLADLDEQAADAVATQILSRKRPGDLVLVSVHWGSNWGFSVPEGQRFFARALIDAGAADIVYGHSSHHPRPMEVYEERLIIYGCGDLVNDYEGIRGHDEYRPELTLMYFPEIDLETGRLQRLVMSPMRIENFTLTRASDGEAQWLAETLSRHSESYGTTASVRDDGRLTLEW